MKEDLSFIPIAVIFIVVLILFLALPKNITEQLEEKDPELQALLGLQSEVYFEELKLKDQVTRLDQLSYASREEKRILEEKLYAQTCVENTLVQETEEELQSIKVRLGILTKNIEEVEEKKELLIVGIAKLEEKQQLLKQQRKKRKQEILK